MLKEIITDTEILGNPLEKVDSVDEIKELACDLLDTAKHFADRCLGLAANQIGGTKRVIVVKRPPFSTSDFTLMINPVIVKKSAEWYVATEGCLSLDGFRKTMRYAWIDVMYRDAKYNIKKIHCTGRMAQIVQHEIDHTNGIII